jgi:hypothetical protein
MDRRRYLLAVLGVSTIMAGCSDESTTDASDGTGETTVAGTATTAPGSAKEPTSPTTNPPSTTSGERTTTRDGNESADAVSTADDAMSTPDGPAGDGETGLDVIHVAGEELTDDGVTRVRMLVSPATDGNVNLGGVTTELRDDEGTTTVTHSGAGSDGSFEVRSVRDENDSLAADTPVLDGLAEHAELQFDVPAAAGGAFEGGSSVELTLRTAGGIESSGRLVFPDTLVGSAVALGTGIDAETGDGVATARPAVEDVSGKVTGGTVESVVLRLLLSPGTEVDEFDLREMVLRYLGPVGVFDLVHDSAGTGDATFTTTAKTDADDSAPVLNDGDDRIDLEFDVSALRGDDGFTGGETVSVHLVTPSGETTTVLLFVPESLPESGEIPL